MLRGINLGSSRRVAMDALRELLEGAGFGEVKTYMQSGNAVLDSELPRSLLEQACSELISERFGFEVAVLARTGEQLQAIVQRNPLPEALVEPKRYQVSFLSQELPVEKLAWLQALASGEEILVAVGRELYAWHPEGVARSKLASGLASRELGVEATARNWTTVSAIAQMASSAQRS